MKKTLNSDEKATNIISYPFNSGELSKMLISMKLPYEAIKHICEKCIFSVGSTTMITKEALRLFPGKDLIVVDSSDFVTDKGEGLAELVYSIAQSYNGFGYRGKKTSANDSDEDDMIWNFLESQEWID